MGNKRAFSAHNFWSEQEIEIVKRLYPLASHGEILLALPGRTISMVQCKANGLGITRVRPKKRTAEETREAKRQHMAAKRAADPIAIRKYQSEHREKHRDRLNAIRRDAHRGRIFWTRALKFKGISAKDLARLWKDQRGLCALTGRKMDRTAQVDHKLPLARGGSDKIENLQWTTAEANRAKRDLTDREFLALCIDASKWIGMRTTLAVAA